MQMSIEGTFGGLAVASEDPVDVTMMLLIPGSDGTIVRGLVQETQGISADALMTQTLTLD